MPEQVPKEDEDELITYGFYVSMGLGFAVGFWILGSLWQFDIQPVMEIHILQVLEYFK